MELTSTQARRLRLVSLLLRPGAPAASTVAEVVEWFGAMQAQDYGSGLWSLGLRLPGRTRDDVVAAMERREALRTWPMRGTVHLVPGRDARWMVEILGARPLAQAARRREQIGLPAETAERGVEVLDVVLAGRRLTRGQCLAELADHGVELAPQVGYHLLWYASQRGVTAIAPHVGNEQTFVRLDDWVPNPYRPSREQALTTIAQRYVRSHGPATRADLIGWTGLTAADVDAGLQGAGESITTVSVEGRPMLVTPDVLEHVGARAAGVVALPGFDELLLGYKDRSLVLADEHQQAIIPGNNGVFAPTLVRDGRVVGVWRAGGSRSRAVTVSPLVALPPSDRERVAARLADYARFLGRSLEARWPDDD